MEKARSGIKISFDCTRRDNYHILAVIAYYNNSASELYTVPLAARPVDGKSGEKTAPTLRDIFASYGILSNLGLFVADGEKTNDVTLRIIGEELGFSADENRVSCYGYHIANVAKAGLEGVGIKRPAKVIAAASEGTVDAALVGEHGVWVKTSAL